MENWQVKVTHEGVIFSSSSLAYPLPTLMRRPSPCCKQVPLWRCKEPEAVPPQAPHRVAPAAGLGPPRWYNGYCKYLAWPHRLRQPQINVQPSSVLHHGHDALAATRIGRIILLA